MPTRLRFIFDGGPDDETRTLREVTDNRNKPRLFGHLARWLPVSEPKNIWALEVDTVDIDRRPIVTLCTLAYTEPAWDVESQLNDNGSIVIRRTRDLADVLTLDEQTIQRERDIQRQRIDLADTLFVINDDGEVPPAMLEEVHYAEAQGKRVQYLRYSEVVSK